MPFETVDGSLPVSGQKSIHSRTLSGLRQVKDEVGSMHEGAQAAADRRPPSPHKGHSVCQAVADIRQLQTCEPVRRVWRAFDGSHGAGWMVRCHPIPDLFQVASGRSRERDVAHQPRRARALPARSRRNALPSIVAPRPASARAGSIGARNPSTRARGPRSATATAAPSDGEAPASACCRAKSSNSGRDGHLPGMGPALTARSLHPQSRDKQARRAPRPTRSPPPAEETRA